MTNKTPPTRIKRHSPASKLQGSKKAILAAFEAALDRATMNCGEGDVLTVTATTQIMNKGFSNAEVKTLNLINII
jgi:hypothetical protein